MNRNRLEFRGAAWAWERVECVDSSQAPTNRSLHASAVYMDSLYIFGGVDIYFSSCITLKLISFFY